MTFFLKDLLKEFTSVLLYFPQIKRIKLFTKSLKSFGMTVIGFETLYKTTLRSSALLDCKQIPYTDTRSKRNSIKSHIFLVFGEFLRFTCSKGKTSGKTEEIEEKTLNFKIAQNAQNLSKLLEIEV